jgi:hypothetical protein
MFLIHNKPEQAPFLAQAILSACHLDNGWPSPAIPKVLMSLFKELLNYEINFENLSRANILDIKERLPNPSQRRELIELMTMMEMLCRPIPKELQDSVDRWAEGLAVDDRTLLLARDLSKNSQLQATLDFYRLNWIGEGDPQDDQHFKELLSHYGDSAYALSLESDPQETARWEKLKNYPDASLGRALWQFYQARGFKLPGEIGGANAALAHHDWVHVIADYDTTAIGELEVTAFMASASRSQGAMLGFIGAVSIYETGLLKSLVTHSYQHTLSAPGGVERVAAAITRGKNCKIDPLLGPDYFSIAHEPLEIIRLNWGLS